MAALTPITAILAADIVAFRDAMDKSATTADEAMTKIEAATVRANNAYRTLENQTDRLAAAQERLDKVAADSKTTDDQMNAALDRVTIAQRNVAAATDTASLAQKNLIKVQEDAAAAADAAALKQKEAAAAVARSYAEEAAAAKESAASQEASMLGISAEASGRLLESLTRVGEVGSLALTFLGYESIKASNSFDAAMMRIHTQAQVPLPEIAGLSKAVLNMAATFGFSPESLAESLYHVESAFESLPPVMIKNGGAANIVAIAAKGAAIGHADLVDTTNALTAAMAANIPGVKNAADTMAVLNGIVGVGDMHMQDLAKAFGTGAVANVKLYGGTIQDIGAMLAVFGDNNIRAQKAGTGLRMAVQAMIPTGKLAEATMEKYGLQLDTLAKDMQGHGINGALTDLINHLKAHGVATNQMGAIITDMFGKRVGPAIGIAVDQYARLESKYPALNQSIKTFGTSWTETNKTAQQQTNEFVNGLKALEIELGQKLTPTYEKLLGYLNQGVAWMKKHEDQVISLARWIGVILVGAIMVWVGSMIIAAGPTLLVIAGIVLLVEWFKRLYDTNKTVRDSVKEVGDYLEKYGPPFLKAVWQEAQKLGQIFMSIAVPAFKAVWQEANIAYKAFKDNILPALKAVWGDVEDHVVPAWNRLQKAIHDNQPVIHDITVVVETLLGWWIKFQMFIDGQLIRAIGQIVTWFAGKLLDSITNVIKVLGGIRDAIQWVIDKFHALMNMGNPLSAITSSLSKMGTGVLAALGFEDGGTVPGPKGAPMLAIVHGGEYVVSNKMMSDGKIGGNTNYAGVPGAGGGGQQPVVENHFYVDGQEIRASVQRQTLRYQARNRTNGLSLPAGRVA
jgi:TP901 family phage tail tape measure protein